jgi:aspartyl-tRNA(Asn)/glutamyl-tRNA(Gln) amidotransferase subunit C
MDANTVKKVARLARLKLSGEEETKRRVREMGGILKFVEQLQEIDTKGVAPLANPNDDFQRLREDIIDSGYTGNFGAQNILANAPEKNSGYFAVPKIVE